MNNFWMWFSFFLIVVIVILIILIIKAKEQLAGSIIVDRPTEEGEVILYLKLRSIDDILNHKYVKLEVDKKLWKTLK